jgi:hypothetical protein
MPMRRSPLLSQLTALLLSVATPVMPVGMALMPLAPAPEAMAPMSADEMMAHEGMHHHDAPSSPADAYRCCDLCAIACGSTATLPTVAATPAIGWLPYETLLPEAPSRPTAPPSSLRLPFAQAPPALLS